MCMVRRYTMIEALADQVAMAMIRPYRDAA